MSITTKLMFFMAITVLSYLFYQIRIFAYLMGAICKLTWDIRESEPLIVRE